MDDIAKPAFGRGRARSRIHGQSPTGAPSPDPSILSTICTASAYPRSGISGSSSTPSEVTSDLQQMAIQGSSDAGTHVPERSDVFQGIAATREEVEIQNEDRRGDYVNSRPPGMEKEGKKGREIKLRANYFRLQKLPSWDIYQYSVDIYANDRTLNRRKIFRKVFEQYSKIDYIYDGAHLFTMKRLEDCDVSLVMKGWAGDWYDRHYVTLTMTYIKLIDSSAPIYVELYNIIIRKRLLELELRQMGRNFFDPKAAIKLPKHRLELWPGYVTSMRTHENDVLLCVEVTHKVLRTDSVLEIMRSIERTGYFRGDEGARKKAVRSDLKDTIVMTVYNNKTYQFDDIGFELSPKSTFNCKETLTSFADYYKERYGVTITDLDQPLIIARASKKEMHRDAIILVPELCRSLGSSAAHPVGLTDAMRANFQLMKELSKYLHQVPDEKVEIIENFMKSFKSTISKELEKWGLKFDHKLFMKRLESNPTIPKELEKWGLKFDHKLFMKRLESNPTLLNELEKWGLIFDDELIDLTGIVLASENVIFANGTRAVDDKGNFTMAFRSQQMLSAVHLNDWAILVPLRDAADVDNLLGNMSRVSAPLSMKIANPAQIINLPDSKIATYLSHLEEVVKKQPNIQMIFVILPGKKQELYAAVKKYLAVDQGIPSQCFLARNVSSKGSMSIARKVAVQINAKLGGEPWSIKLPLQNTMFIGFDVHKGAEWTTGGTIGAMVATFSSNFTKYFSTTSVYADSGEELSKNIQADVKKCIEAYQEENNGELPEKIVMYRDGVDEHQLQLISNVELILIKEELHEIYSAKGWKDPALTYIVLNKRMKTRLFEMKQETSNDNPPPGTVVDSTITFPDRYDFYLISCCARQGTVSPCYYNVLFDGSGLDMDKIQLITYKMCHMYFNWSESIAVPAPCQYAHKLAFLTGTTYAGHANKKLSKLLHFL